MIPTYLDSQCAVDICRDPQCPTAVKVNPQTGRAYITISHAGFNSPANNGLGYATVAAAWAAIRRYANGRAK